MADFLSSQQTGTQTVSSAIDPQLKQAYLDQIAAANAVANRPFQQYEGPQVAGFNQDQQDAFGYARQTAAGPSSFLTGNINQYMNPYTDQVINQSLQDNDRARLMQQQGINAQAASRGAYGGSRQAVAESENNRNFMDQQARTSAQLRSQGFENAAARMGQDIDRTFLGRQQLAQFGGLQQQQVQQNYNVAKQQFDNQFNYPLQQLAIRQSALPQPEAFGKTTNTPIYENQAANLLGLAGAGTGVLKNLGITGGDVLGGAKTALNFLGGQASNLFGGGQPTFQSPFGGTTNLFPTPGQSTGDDIGYRPSAPLFGNFDSTFG